MPVPRPGDEAAPPRVDYDDMDETRRAVAEEAGQTMPEYGVVLGVITLAIVTALGLITAGLVNLIGGVIPLV
ncbi:MAG TPA: hypothetical protein VE777_21005 [Gaiellales bacterium]|jgi:Flp pilus assembly pilin Flp|nr:hypothetical protein [Gaiellales bacterium]